MKLQIITESDNPIILRTIFRPAAICIKFPNGDIWEYVLYDDELLRDLLKKYRFNVGNLVAALKRMKVEANKLQTQKLAGG